MTAPVPVDPDYRVRFDVRWESSATAESDDWNKTAFYADRHRRLKAVRQRLLLLRFHQRDPLRHQRR